MSKKRSSNFNPDNDKDFEKFIKELSGKNNRATAILAGAWVESKLSKLLSSFMINSDETNKLLDVDAPLGTFNAKIKAAYCLGLLTEVQYKNLKIIKDIRNNFAHQIDLNTFNDTWITERCNELVCYSLLDSTGIRHTTSPGDIFVSTVFEIGIQLWSNIFEDSELEKRTVPSDSFRINYELD